MTLSEQQISGIRLLIVNGGVTTPRLQDDLLDHLCCVVEYRMKDGEDYNNALAVAVSELAPDGLADIQHETHFLLNSKRILFMKRITYILGCLFSMEFLIGWLFAFLHLPGANELITGGVMGIGLVFVPLLAFDYFKVKIQRAMSEKIMVVTGVFSLGAIAIAVALEMLESDGADILLLVGFLCMIVGFMPLLFYKLYTKSVARG